MFDKITEFLTKLRHFGQKYGNVMCRCFSLFVLYINIEIGKIDVKCWTRR